MRLSLCALVVLLLLLPHQCCSGAYSRNASCRERQSAPVEIDDRSHSTEEVLQLVLVVLGLALPQLLLPLLLQPLLPYSSRLGRNAWIQVTHTALACCICLQCSSCKQPVPGCLCCYQQYLPVLTTPPQPHNTPAQGDGVRLCTALARGSTHIHLDVFRLRCQGLHQSPQSRCLDTIIIADQDLVLAASPSGSSVCHVIMS